MKSIKQYFHPASGRRLRLAEWYKYPHIVDEIYLFLKACLEAGDSLTLAKSRLGIYRGNPELMRALSEQTDYDNLRSEYLLNSVRNRGFS